MTPDEINRAALAAHNLPVHLAEVMTATDQETAMHQAEILAAHGAGRVPAPDPAQGHGARKPASTGSLLDADPADIKAALRDLGIRR